MVVMYDQSKMIVNYGSVVDMVVGIDYGQLMVMVMVVFFDSGIIIFLEDYLEVVLQEEQQQVQQLKDDSYLQDLSFSGSIDG